MKRPSIQILILSLTIAPLFVGCGKKFENEISVDPEAAVIESATSLLGGMPDDQAGSSYARLSPVNWKKQLLLPEAFASGCSRPVYASCNSGVRSENYVNCNPGVSNYVLNGSAQLSYSDSVCGLSSNGDSVTRTYDVSISGPRGGELALSSATHSDYRGTSYGGGGKLTVTPAGWNLEVLGKRKVLSYKGQSLYDVSLRTLSPIQVSGSLSRSARQMTSGQLEVNHNLAQFTAVFTPQNLQWNNSCCHPVSGTLNVAWSGSKTGTATVTFQGCGQAEVNENGQTRDIEISYCE